MQDSGLKSQNFVGFEQCNSKWNSSSIIPELQTGQNLSLWVCGYLYEFSLSLSYWLKWWAHTYTPGTPRDRYLVDVYRVAVKLSRNSRNKIKRYRPGITHWNYVFSSRSKEADKAQSPFAETQLLWKFNTLRKGQSFCSNLGL